jgi:hypothetical protein
MHDIRVVKNVTQPIDKNCTPCNGFIIFLGQEEDAVDREYGGIPKSFVYLPGTASDSERLLQLLDWGSIDQVNVINPLSYIAP